MPDTMGAVGPRQVLVVVNGRLRIFNKAGSLQFDADLASFFDPVRGPADVADPHVRYDRLSKRWFIVAITSAGIPNEVLVAVSSGPTITAASSFRFFSFGQPAADASLFADYPTLGVDRSALYIGTNNAAASGDELNVVSSSGFVLPKAGLLNGSPSVFAFRNLSTTSTAGPVTPQGVQNDDPAATTGFFIGPDRQSLGLLDIMRIGDPGGAPTISGPLALTVPPFANPINVPAQGTSTTLNAIDNRLYAAMIAKDPATGDDRLWTAHTIQVDSSGNASASGGRDGARWYEIGGLTSTPTLIQSGVVFDSAASSPAFFWVPSIAANGQGQAVIASSIAGLGRFAGIAVAQRLFGDPTGTMSVPQIAQPGIAAYDQPGGATPDGSQRWGDYSQTVIDPNDEMTFWTFQEYTNATNSWAVRAIEVRAPPPATPVGASPSTLPAGASVRVAITGTSIDGSGFFDPGPDRGGPGFASHIKASVSRGVVVKGVTFVDPTRVVLDLDTRHASGGRANVLITNPDGQAEAGQALLAVPDRVAPKTTVSGPRVTGDDTPTFRFGSSEQRATFRCKVDRGAFRRCHSPKTVGPLRPGVHRFRVRATDSAGNTDPTPAVRVFTVLP